TASVASTVPAPGRLSTTKDGPPVRVIWSARSRDMLSLMPPGAYGTTILMGRVCDQAPSPRNVMFDAMTTPKAIAARLRNLRDEIFIGPSHIARLSLGQTTIPGQVGVLRHLPRQLLYRAPCCAPGQASVSRYRLNRNGVQPHT